MACDECQLAESIPSAFKRLIWVLHIYENHIPSPPQAKLPPKLSSQPAYKAATIFIVTAFTLKLVCNAFMSALLEIERMFWRTEFQPQHHFEQHETAKFYFQDALVRLYASS